MGLIARLGRCLLLLAAAACARAQTIDDVELRREGDDAVVQVRFVGTVQVRRLLATRSGDVAQIFYDLLAAPDLPATPTGERRLPGRGGLPDITVSDEAVAGDPLRRRLLVRLSKPAPMRVRAGRDDRAIEIVLADLGAALPAPGWRVVLQRSERPQLLLDAPIPASMQRYEVFTSQRQLQGRTVHEASLGYFASLAEAEAARLQLLARFPQAEVVEPAAPVSIATPAAPAASTPSAPADVEARGAELLAAARAADAAGDSALALQHINELLDLPPNGASRAAQAMAGPLREKLGDSRRAAAEYETFLRLYPSGQDADLARQALARLALAPRPTARRPAKIEPSTTLGGSLSGFYYGGSSKVRTQEFQDSPISGLPQLVSDNTLSGTEQSQLQTAVDVNWRHRDNDHDMRFVFRDAYTANLLDRDRDRNRLSALYFDHRSRALGTNVRLGRQSATGAGVLGRFDGISAGYGFAPKWRVNGVAGVPSDKLLDSRRRFYGGSIDAEALAPGLSASLYAIRQTIDGETDRSAVGSEMRYFAGGLSANASVDYDRMLHTLNVASLQGTWQSADLQVLNFLYDRRKTPLLTLGNALFFQDPLLPPATRIRDLLASGVPVDTLRERVRATTSDTTQALLGATLPLTARWQIGADLRLTDVGEILPVVDILPAGQGRSRNTAIGGQLIGINLYSSRDTHVLSGSWLRGANYTLGAAAEPDRYSGKLLGYNNSTQITELLLLEPSLRLYRQDDSLGVRTTRWTPGLRISYRVVRQLALESELSAEFSKSSGPTRNESSRRTYYYLGGRYDF